MDPNSIEYNPRAAPKRGGCLTLWLGLMVVGNVILATFYGATFFAPGANALDLPRGAAALIVLLLMANAVFAAGVWLWQKWGVYGVAANTLIAFGLNLYLGTPILSALSGFVGLLILIGLVRPVWEHMR